MVDDSERREMARRLREIRPCKSGHIKWWGIAQALGLKEPAGWFGWEKFEPESVQRLADLIDPPAAAHECVPGECPLNARHDNDHIDRDALLALADDIDKQTDGSMFDAWLEDGHYIARRIREACGEVER